MATRPSSAPKVGEGNLVREVELPDCSPVHNVVEGGENALEVTMSVGPAHSFKFAAELQEKQAGFLDMSKRWFLLRSHFRRS